MTKLRLFLTTLILLLPLHPLRIATAQQTASHTPPIPQNAQLVNSGEVVLWINGKPETVTYAVYQQEITVDSFEALNPSPLALTQKEYVCGITVIALGITGTLEQHVVATFSSSIPIGWQWNNGWTVATHPLVWWWINVTNPPFINSGYNQGFATQDTSIANGTVTYALAPRFAELYIRATYGTTSNLPPQPTFACQGDRGRLSPPG